MIIIFAAILAICGTGAFALFRMYNDKQNELDQDIINAYTHLRDHTLDPILKEIFGSKRGKYNPHDFFNTPEVVVKLDCYRKELFKFNKVSEMKEIIIMMLKLSTKTIIGIMIITGMFIVINELFVNSNYNTFGISVFHVIILYFSILVILFIFFSVFIHNYTCINNSFKTRIQELKGGL